MEVWPKIEISIDTQTPYSDGFGFQMLGRENSHCFPVFGDGVSKQVRRGLYTHAKNDHLHYNPIISTTHPRRLTAGT